MNTFEKVMVGLLFAVLISWGFLYKKMMPPPPPAPVAKEAAAAAAPSGPASIQATAETPAAPAQPERQLAPEQTCTLRNKELALTFSTRYGGITTAEMLTLPATQAPKSPPLQLNFQPHPALAVGNIPELSGMTDYTIESVVQDHTVTLEKTTTGGIKLRRTFELNDAYQIRITDVFTNTAQTAQTIPAHDITTGAMHIQPTGRKTDESGFLGIDSLPTGGEKAAKVQHWMATSMFRKTPLVQEFTRLSTPAGGVPAEAQVATNAPVAWIAAKNKFFVQLLYAKDGNAGCTLKGTSDPDTKGLLISSVAAAVNYPAITLEPGKSFTRESTCYLGPKNYALLRQLGEPRQRTGPAWVSWYLFKNNQESSVMEFGVWLNWLCKALLLMLTSLFAVVKNYGVAIILLTFIVRIIFWPITHRSNESMKKMTAIQPLIKALQEKHKNQPQQLQQEMMLLYREHKVNPMGGCLPMLIQIPVFIALFTILRSAVELRFAKFLWIRDLSEAENLFNGAIPLIGSLNILPLLMTATSIWQQKLMPSTGDKQQQMMMTFMSVFMLVIFYKMPSALVLYWTVSQVASIAQLLWQQWKHPVTPITKSA
jgi:YidC/Oxa1 family membrane protein insertase